MHQYLHCGGYDHLLLQRVSGENFENKIAESFYLTDRQ